ncbi:hypothetical protein LZ198_36525 [Myxococcus sp. K15C18031901]|uniref:hypothetical protein n=1 Tax=Myxococcus dinghuensis TaxID=2906761 RepID=UPI0020A78587|nr:hypothetical protein [Myxococcus dinghuensis]MCP3104384.1 hypothetical protein [Myxococcus dinghuensis]
MNKKLYVLGAVLGTLPGLLPGGAGLSDGAPVGVERSSPGVFRDTSPRVGAAPLARDGVAPEAQEAGGPEGPHHPCHLMTVAKVPCDEAREVCEFTYWECPRGGQPLGA